MEKKVTKKAWEFYLKHQAAINTFVIVAAYGTTMFCMGRGMQSAVDKAYWIGVTDTLENAVKSGIIPSAK